MIYVMLTDDKSDELQPKIVKFLNTHFDGKIDKFQIKFIFCPEHIIEKKLPIFESTDYILWHPKVAGNNLDIMKQHKHSIVVLKNKTLLIQKVSKNNPITENQAINHEFKIMYIDPNEDDITNEEWQLVISEEHYTITIEKLIQLNNGTKS
jgi:hypothetical protein